MLHKAKHVNQNNRDFDLNQNQNQNQHIARYTLGYSHPAGLNAQKSDFSS